MLPVKKVLLAVIMLVFKILDFFVPKKEIYLFSQVGGRFNGNSKIFFEYLIDNKIPNVYWLTHEKITRKEQCNDIYIPLKLCF